ncbi:hypothetical protein Q1695_012704 [Nippostrongylus brasiliensis]|nr:hypothetical protein Q1695_012704 [Nippostrongylus brasiliensis]
MCFRRKKAGKKASEREELSESTATPMNPISVSSETPKSRSQTEDGQRPSPAQRQRTKTARRSKGQSSVSSPHTSQASSSTMPTDKHAETPIEDPTQRPETKSGMSHEEFRRYGRDTIDYVADYMENIHERRVVPTVEPGYLKSLIPLEAPQKPEPYKAMLEDFERVIMPGITHWQHPRFHAYFPAGNSYPSILADLLCDMTGAMGFSWAACPAMTELEVIMMQWFGKMLGLPKEFLPLTEGGRGGGVIQGSASDCNLVSLLAARFDIIKELRKRFPFVEEGLLLSKLIAYCSKEAHSSVEKACMIGMVKLRILETDSHFRLRGDTLRSAIQEDRNLGLIPFFVSTTLGTTSVCSFDVLSEIGPVCHENELWMHVDGAYGGSAMICPEFRYLMKGIEYASSFNTNPNKWMLVNFDCSTMWVKDRFKLTQALVVDPLYLHHSWEEQSIDYRHWGIPLSRRFRALKLWFVIRSYGVEGLQKYMREHVRLAKKMEALLSADPMFELVGDVIMGLVCFRMRGSDERNKQLLTTLNSSGKIHMVPASLNDRFVIRFCVCAENACDEDIDIAYNIISTTAKQISQEVAALPVVDESIDSVDEDSVSTTDRIIAGTDSDVRITGGIDGQMTKEELIAQKRDENIAKKRSFLVRMVSDPKCYNPKIVRHLNMSNHRKMSQDVYRDRSLMHTISHSQKSGSAGSTSYSTNSNFDEGVEEVCVALSQTGLQTPI